MRSLMIAGAAAVTLSAALAGAASAQPYDRRYDDRNDRWEPVTQRIEQIDRRIERGIRNGDLTRREAGMLRRDLDQVVRLEARYRYDGLNRWERDDLSRRIDVVAQRVRFERRDDDQRYDRRDDREYGYRR